MWDIVVNLFSMILGKLWNFLFVMKISGNISLGLVLILISLLGLILFIIFSVINGKDG